MSDLPEHLRDQYGSQPQDDDSQYHTQQSYYQAQAGMNYPPSAQQQPTMNQSQGSGGRHTALNMGALAGALPDPNYGQAFAQQSPQRYQTLPPNAAISYQLQQPFAQAPAGQLSRNQQANSQYLPQFQQQQFQGMYLQGPGGHIQPVQGGLPMNQQQYPGQGFAQQQRPQGIQQQQQQQQQQQNPQFYYQQAALYSGQTQMFQGGVFPPQHGSNPSSRRPSEQLRVGASSDIGRASSIGSSAGIPTTIRGPPRKPKQSGHALWVGNLPPGASVVDLKDHFAQDATEDILSVFLISKSSCAFVNYKTEEARAAAMARFHDSRLKGVRLVCRLRRSAASVPGGVPTGPAALVGTGGRAEVDSGAGGADGDAGKDVDGEEDEGGDGAPTVDEGVGAPAKDKYFIVKSLTVEDLEMSVRNGVWATQSHNEAALDRAYKTAESVYLIFSANKSGEYYGYARMTSPINQDPAAKISFGPPPTSAAAPVTEPRAAGAAGGTALNDPDQPTATITPASATAPRGRIIDDSARGTIFWEADGAGSPAEGDSGGNSNGDGGSGSGDEESPSPPLAGSGAGGAAWGKPFSIEWESTRRVPFFRTRGLKNAWNAGREVKIARDGTEIETRVGRRLIGLFGGVGGPAGRDGGGEGR
ncbi:hypothetical protein VE00_00832 [Pseudogymnoascus sp. WSF 3629]|nr:hypothetical protein VE00_00832 [Pseudogymnoascus sp. WSF 3629]